MKVTEAFSRVAMLACLASFSSVVEAQTYFVDDFSGMVNEAGREPVTWIGAFGWGAPSSENDDLKPNFFAQIAGDTMDVTYTDVSLRTEFRMTRGGTGMGVGLRWDESLGMSYGVTISEQRARILVGGIQETLAETPVDFNLTTEDVAIQFDVFDDQMRLWAWPAIEEQPALPLLTASDSRIESGKLFVFNSFGNGVFRSLEVLPIPEPSTRFPTFLGFMLLLRNRRRWRQLSTR